MSDERTFPHTPGHTSPPLTRTTRPLTLLTRYVRTTSYHGALGVTKDVARTLYSVGLTMRTGDSLRSQIHPYEEFVRHTLFL